MDYVICHYGEIALKGKNRKFFEEKLVENIKKSLSKDSFDFVKRISGRIIVKLTTRGLQKKEEIKKSLKNVFGLSSFAFAELCPQSIEAMKKSALKILKDPVRDLSLSGVKTFRITAQRAEKDFPLTSQQINEKIGDYILKKLKTRVDLEKPEITCFVEIANPIRNLSGSNGARKYAFLYTEKIKGAGGLPVGVSGKVISLLSGGIDSPVASYYLMKRGAKVVFLHFHSYPQTDKASIDKVQRMAETLNKFQFDSKLYLVPFLTIQKEILSKTQEKLRVVLYRRMMLRIAEEIARKEGALAMVTGENLGQVASQTLENIKAIEEAVNLPVFRPLIGFDKQEIINKAKEIGTYEISILAHQDCCSLFVPKHPETRAKLEEVKEAEGKLNIKKLIKEAIQKTEVCSENNF